MNTYRMLSPLQRLISLAAGVMAALMLFYGARFVFSAAVQQERKIEDQIPKHLPIKVKIKSSDKVKNLNNEKWAGDIEIEVENTGDKPIYFLSLSVFFIDVKPDSGDEWGWPLRYGRPKLMQISNQATPEDIPIKPGETYVFQSPEGLAKGWPIFRAEHNKPDPQKLGIRFHVLNHGDNTGYVTTSGKPVPRLTSR